MKGRFFWPLLIAILVLALDFITKQLVVDFLPQSGGHDIVLFKDVIGIDCSIVHATNKGAAWGSFDRFPLFLVALRLVLISCLIGYMAIGKIKDCYTLPFLLIISGAIGNVIDFFLYGHVIDMIRCVFWGYSYPVFNIADSAICVGTFFIVLFTIREKEASV
ncbi:MAG: lspA [Chlamydiia bacterium]|nr:lspA [Chlamydiia bacterium]